MEEYKNCKNKNEKLIEKLCNDLFKKNRSLSFKEENILKKKFVPKLK